MTSDASVVGRWLMAELVSPGGDARAASRARRRLDDIGDGDMFAHLARGLDDSLHGRLKAAPAHYLEAVESARESSDPRAPLVAWFGADRAVSIGRRRAKLWDRWRGFVAAALQAPGHVGWRARGTLVQWWAQIADERAEKRVDERAAAKFGCVRHVRLAGPFGRGAPADALRSHAAEAPGAWPYRWKPEPGVSTAPHVLETKRHGCTVEADETAPAGVYYAETFLELDRPRDLLLAVQGAVAVWLDDDLVLDRDSRRWGIWPDFGTHVRLDAGTHRVLARLTSPSTNVRVMDPAGSPAAVTTREGGSSSYSLVPPELRGNPNALMKYLRHGSVVGLDDDATRYLAARLAHMEGQDDVASVMLEPLVRDAAHATGPVLSAAALFAEGDPIFTQTQRRDLARSLYERAAAKDPLLWTARLHLALGEAQRGGPAEAIAPLRALAKSFPDVPAVPQALARIYGELGWAPEHEAVARRLAERFPDDVGALEGAVSVLDGIGEPARADSLVRRIEALDPDNEIALSRALARHDYGTAVEELKRLGNRHPERKDIASRIHDVMVRAGNSREAWKKLEAAIADDPTDESARLALADARFAAGDHGALRKAVVDAVESGAGISTLVNAIDLVEGMTELDPYRLDAQAVIRDFEASGLQLAGTAARVLDYMAVWVRSDGSSKLLEHEIIRIQSKEAIDHLAEYRRLPGLVLAMRVIKKDGRMLEPEQIAGKPTVTMPHLEVGDYIETEQIMRQAAEGRGMRYLGPHWFFREQNVAYARSELVVISPKDRELSIETRGDVPEPEVVDLGHAVLRRWLVHASPAAPVEPNSPPIEEFLPSVRVGWGVSLAYQIGRLADSVAMVTPVDPRIARIARRIVDPIPPTKQRARARRLYRWILANVEDGKETDGRRVVVGKRGNRWKGFIELCRALDIPVTYAIARNRLAMPPAGPISEATAYTEPVLEVGHGPSATWLTVGSKFAPFGYVPAQIRGASAYLLSGSQPKLVRTPARGTTDSLEYEGTIDLAPGGAAKLHLVQRFHGKFAMGLRATFDQLPPRQLFDVVESRLLGRALRGARLLDYHVDHLDDPDSPLTIRMEAEMSTFAQVSGGMLVVSPPFAPRISRLAALPSRQTPLLIGESSHQKVRVKINLPPGARVVTGSRHREIAAGTRIVRIDDDASGRHLELVRVLDIPAGRIQPADYPDFVEFAREADNALSRSIRIRIE